MARPKSEHTWTSVSARLTVQARELFYWYVEQQQKRYPTVTRSEFLWYPGLMKSLDLARKLARRRKRPVPSWTDLGIHPEILSRAGIKSK